MKLGTQVGLGPGTNRLDFGIDRDPGLRGCTATSWAHHIVDDCYTENTGYATALRGPSGYALIIMMMMMMMMMMMSLGDCLSVCPM